MTLVEAIKILMEDTQHPTAGFMPDLLEAERLGIGALKRVMQMRAVKDNIALRLLIGETKK